MNEILIQAFIARSFNPCFGGSYIVTPVMGIDLFFVASFNPCFGGSYIVTFFGVVKNLQ